MKWVNEVKDEKNFAINSTQLGEFISDFSESLLAEKYIQNMPLKSQMARIRGSQIVNS